MTSLSHLDSIIIIYCICVSTYVLLASNEYLILRLLKHTVTIWYIAVYTNILTWMLSLYHLFYLNLFICFLFVGIEAAVRSDKDPKVIQRI